MNKFRNAVQQAIKQSKTKDEIKITAEDNRFLVDNYVLRNDQITVYSVEELAKKQYPEAIEGYVSDVWGTITWTVDTAWTGQGFRFMPRVKDIEISMTATINVGEDKDFEDVELSFPVDMDKVEIEIEEKSNGGCYLELSNIEIDCASGKTKVIFIK